MYCKQKRGFTLIELLVVVLIIGILAAVALPQYNRAVKKAHMAEVLTIMDANSKDAQVYLLEHGELDRWGNMISSYADQLEKNERGNLSGGFGTHFQIGCGDASPLYANGKDTFYCVRPKNGDKAYIYHFIDNMGKITRICAGNDCGQYVTGETCFATPNGCWDGAVVLRSGCSF